jgi:HlyD family secretion protein
MIWVRRLAFLALLATVAAAAIYALLPKPVLVDVATVDRGPLAVTVDEQGVARVREVYEVSAPISGQLDRFPLEVGDAVERGVTIVAEIRPAEPSLLDVRSRAELEAALEAATAAVRLAEAELSAAEAELSLAEADLERVQELAESGTVSTRAEEQALTNAFTARASLQRAEANLLLRRSEQASAQARLMEPGQSPISDSGCCVEVRAPIDGVVLKVMAESEQVVQAGAPIAEIGDLGDMEVLVDLLSADAVRISPGAEAWVESWGGETLAARVRRIDPAAFTKVSALGIEEQRVNVALDLLAPSAARERLGHEFEVFVRVLVWRSDDVLKVPLAALFRQGLDWSVFRVVEGRARMAKLVIDHRDSTTADVVEGLSAGDWVILHPSDDIEDGVRVEERGD